MQYTASTINRTALPRSKRMRALGAASVTPTVVNGESGDKYWNGEIDTETEETEVSTTYPVKISKRLRIVDESGALYGDISIDANGRFVFDKGIISKEDIIAYGVGGSDIKSVTDVIEEYLAEHGVGGYEPPVGGIPKSDLSSSVQASLGKADTALQEHQSLQGYATEQWVEGKGYLTSHQNISGKLDKSAWNVGRTTSQQTDWNSFTTNGNYFVHNAAVTNKPSNVDWYGQLLVLRGDTTDTITQLYFPYNGSNPVMRSGNPLKSGGSWNAWKTIAYTSDITSSVGALDVADTAVANQFVTAVSETDGKISVSRASLTATNIAQAGKLSNATSGKADTAGLSDRLVRHDYSNGSSWALAWWGDNNAVYATPGVTITPNTKTITATTFAGNASTATELATARTIWGQSFDGSADVNGYVIINNNYGVKGKDTGGTARTLLTLNTSNQVNLAYETAGAGYDTYINGNNTIFRQGAGHTEKMRLTSDGNVGIGTTSPSEKLHVLGNARLSSSDSGAGGDVCLDLWRGTNASWKILNTGGKLQFQNNYTDKVGSFTTAVTMLYNSGNVGIGTDSPAYKLDVIGEIRSKVTTGTARLRANYNGTNEIRMYADSAIVGMWGQNNAPMVFATNNIERMRLTSDGKLGIGTTTPSSPLDISTSGSYKSGIIKINTSNSDNLDRVFSVYAPNAAPGRMVVYFEKDPSKYNAGYMGYRYVEASKATNYLTFGFFGSDDLVKIFGDGAMSVAGNIRIESTASENRHYLKIGGYNRLTNWNSDITATVLYGSKYAFNNHNGETLANIETYGGIRANVKSGNYSFICAPVSGNSNACVAYMPNNQSTKKWLVGSASDYAFKWWYSATAGDTGWSSKLTLDTSGNLVATGDVTAYSDKRLKSDIKELEYRGPLEPKTYVKDGKKSIGFIAQEVRELYPELVLGEEKEDEYLSLNYGAITAVLAAENKELHKKVGSLEERIEKLEALINKLIEEK